MANETWVWMKRRDGGKAAHAYMTPMAGWPYCGRSLDGLRMVSASATTPRCKACVKKVRELAGTTGAP